MIFRENIFFRREGQRANGRGGLRVFFAALSEARRLREIRSEEAWARPRGADQYPGCNGQWCSTRDTFAGAEGSFSVRPSVGLACIVRLG